MIGMKWRSVEALLIEYTVAIVWLEDDVVEDAIELVEEVGGDEEEEGGDDGGEEGGWNSRGGGSGE